jgi:polar amino acid transport system substrate-binding protein
MNSLLKPSMRLLRALIATVLLIAGVVQAQGQSPIPTVRTLTRTDAVSTQRTTNMTMMRLASGALVSTDIGQILQRGELVVAMLATDTPPFFYSDGEKFSGTDVRMAEQIAAELKVPLRIDRSAKSFNEVVEIVARGDADLGASKLSRTLARAQSVRFSDPYLSLNHALIINRLEFAKISRDIPLPTVIRNLTGSIGVIAKSSFAEFAVRNFPKAKIVQYPSWNEVLEAVKRGDIVCAYRDEFEIRRILENDPSLALTLRTITLKDLNDSLGIAIGTHSPNLLAFVNQFLAQRREKLTIDSVLAELK